MTPISDDNDEAIRPSRESERVRYGRLIHTYRTRNNLSQADLASLLFVDRNSVTNWELGRSRPPIQVILRLCDVLSMPLETFFNVPRHAGSLSFEEQDAVLFYHRLNDHDRQVIDTLIASIHDSQQARLRRRCLSDFVTLQRIDIHAGVFPEETVTDTRHPVYVRRSFLTETATHIALVEGDAMEPDYPGGSDVYIQRTDDLHPSDLVLAAVRGHFLIRELRSDCLHASNPLRGDIPFRADGNSCLIGKVLSLVPKQDLPSEGEQEMLETIAWENQHRL